MLDSIYFKVFAVIGISYGFYLAAMTVSTMDPLLLQEICKVAKYRNIAADTPVFLQGDADDTTNAGAWLHSMSAWPGLARRPTRAAAAARRASRGFTT